MNDAPVVNSTATVWLDATPEALALLAKLAEVDAQADVYDSSDRAA